MVHKATLSSLLCIGWYTKQHYPHCSVLVVTHDYSILIETSLLYVFTDWITRTTHCTRIMISGWIVVSLLNALITKSNQCWIVLISVISRTYCSFDLSGCCKSSLLLQVYIHSSYCIWAFSYERVNNVQAAQLSITLMIPSLAGHISHHCSFFLFLMLDNKNRQYCSYEPKTCIRSCLTALERMEIVGDSDSFFICPWVFENSKHNNNMWRDYHCLALFRYTFWFREASILFNLLSLKRWQH